MNISARRGCSIDGVEMCIQCSVYTERLGAIGGNSAAVGGHGKSAAANETSADIANEAACVAMDALVVEPSRHQQVEMDGKAQAARAQNVGKQEENGAACEDAAEAVMVGEVAFFSSMVGEVAKGVAVTHAGDADTALAGQTAPVCGVLGKEKDNASADIANEAACVAMDALVVEPSGSAEAKAVPVVMMTAHCFPCVP